MVTYFGNEVSPLIDPVKDIEALNDAMVTPEETSVIDTVETKLCLA